MTEVKTEKDQNSAIVSINTFDLLRKDYELIQLKVKSVERKLGRVEDMLSMMITMAEEDLYYKVKIREIAEHKRTDEFRES